MTDRVPGEGGKSFFLLAAVILGGLLFALGVMVGRATSPDGSTPDPDLLGRIDARDARPLAVADGDLEFPAALSGPAQKVAESKPPRNKPVLVDKPSDPPADPPPTRATDDGAANPTAVLHCLQVASFQRKDQADQLVDKLRGRGLPDVRTVSGDVEGKGTYYRVRVGRFTKREDAEALNQKESLEGLIIQSEQ